MLLFPQIKFASGGCVSLKISILIFRLVDQTTEKFIKIFKKFFQLQKYSKRDQNLKDK